MLMRANEYTNFHWSCSILKLYSVVKLELIQATHAHKRTEREVCDMKKNSRIVEHRNNKHMKWERVGVLEENRNNKILSTNNLKIEYLVRVESRKLSYSHSLIRTYTQIHAYASLCAHTFQWATPCLNRMTCLFYFAVCSSCCWCCSKITLRRH